MEMNHPAGIGATCEPSLRGDLDGESRRWLCSLRPEASDRENAVSALRDRLARVARREAVRRGPRTRIGAAELEDLAEQAASDATVAILSKLGRFRGESRFTTWAYAFVVRELSNKIGRHQSWRGEVSLGPEDWDRFPSRLGVDPAQEVEAAELVVALRRAVEEQLTVRQRRVFVALVLHGVPLDALAAELGSNRNALYKTLFDARRRLRAALVAEGQLGEREDAR